MRVRLFIVGLVLFGLMIVTSNVVVALDETGDAQIQVHIPSYVSGEFAVGINAGRQITVPLNATVAVTVVLNSTDLDIGDLSITIRRDISGGADSNKITCTTPNLVLVPGQQEISTCSFVADEPTIGSFRQYFLRVSWDGSFIYNPSDPGSREFVVTGPPLANQVGSIDVGTLVLSPSVQDFQIPIDVLSPLVDAFAGFSGEITYDPSVIELTGATSPVDGSSVVVTPGPSGTFGIIVVDLSPIVSSTGTDYTIANINGSVVGDPGASTDLILEVSDFFLNESGDIVIGAVNNGNLRIQTPAEVPSLTEWSLIVLGTSFVAANLYLTRRRRWSHFLGRGRS